MECHEGFGLSWESCGETNCHGYGDSTLPHPVEWLNEPCGNCHAEYTGNPHVFTFDLEAGGFNLTVNPDDTGEKAAHKTFVLDAITNEHMEGANEACIGCHTHVPVKINWTHASV
ncbi:hypothetical protein H8E77_39430 [bacterium]|nr:hypothetical protein [bacterium]